MNATSGSALDQLPRLNRWRLIAAFVFHIPAGSRKRPPRKAQHVVADTADGYLLRWQKRAPRPVALSISTRDLRTLDRPAPLAKPVVVPPEVLRVDRVPRLQPCR